MGLIKGGALRLLQTALYALAFCCAGIILGIYSYFLSVLADRDAFIPKYVKAVEGISGIAVVYTILAVILTCCLGGITFFSFLGLVLDVLFVGGFIALAILMRKGAQTCNGSNDTPLGQYALPNGLGFGGEDNQGDNSITYAVKNRTACGLNKACFAVAIIGAFLFLITAFMQIALSRHHKKEKRYGPSPSNNYTSGYGKKKSLFSRKKNVEKDAEYGTAAGAGGLGVAAADTRPSHETGYTGTTIGGNAPVHEDKLHAPAPLPTHGAYHTQPQGTGVNPYGYSAGTATNY